MTTTLRPLEPERHGPEGRRQRRYAVCVNSRQVGEVLVAAEPLAGPVPGGTAGETAGEAAGKPTARRSGPLLGTVSGLSIGEPDRRRGRGTVAALAAEEVLRQWGCTRVEAAVPGDSEAGARLATALGYVERNRQLVKRLPGTAPALPPGCLPRPMTDAEFPGWLEHERAEYARTWVAAGMTPSEAREKAEAGCRMYLPEGTATPGAVLRVLAGGGEDVGTLWLALRGRAGPGQAWVFSVQVGAEYRGRGYGRALMLLAEAECVTAGVRELGLNVFTENSAAVGLYESLGYQTVRRYFAKPLL